jgi:E3 ubiquitin-protein ligase UHRF1
MTENAKRKGLSNAACGRMRVTCPPHHFGPITAEHDPERGRGVLVGECWQNRLHCRQWGSHLPHVAGIAGQSDVGAQSVVLSGEHRLPYMLSTVSICMSENAWPCLHILGQNPC